jgi:HK97 family phage major capsid protein
MPPAPPGITQPPWSTMFPAQVVAVISAIVGGANFARSLSALPTNRTSVSFPQLDPEDPEWVAELGVIPTLNADQSEHEVAVSKLAGSILVSLESIDDTDFPAVQQTEQILQDTFSAKLDRDFIGGAGPHPTPTGILAVAAEVAGADWLAAAVRAKADIATAGGTPSHIALSPAVIGDLEGTRDDIGHQLYPDASTVFAGLETVSAVAATQPVVYDASRLWMVIRRDFEVNMSDQVSEAWNRYARSVRVVGRFALAAPLPSRSVRKLAVTETAASTGARAKTG